MGRPRQHDEATGVRLLDVAEELLATGGASAVTVRAVAEAAGTTTRAVYAVFGSKEVLLAELANRGYDLLTGLVSELPETDDAAADLIRAGLRGFRTFALGRPHLFRLTFNEVSAVMAHPATETAAWASYQSLVRWIRRAKRAGAIRRLPDEQIAFVYHSLCVGLASSELSRLPPPEGAGFWQPVHGVDGEQLWTTGLTALVHGLAPRRTGRRRG